MKELDRRAFMSAGFAVATAASLRLTTDDESGLALSNRAHIFASPKFKEKLIWCFRDVIGCEAPISVRASGLREPILAFRFPAGGSFTVDFSEDSLDEQKARRGAWLEIWSNDPAALRRKILDAGLPQVTYPATNRFYFAAPVGQVFGISERK